MRRPWIWTPDRQAFLESNWDVLPLPRIANELGLPQSSVLRWALKSGTAGRAKSGELPRGAKALQLVWRPSTEPEEETA